jgi:hypothetical protein
MGDQFRKSGDNVHLWILLDAPVPLAPPVTDHEVTWRLILARGRLNSTSVITWKSATLKTFYELQLGVLCRGSFVSYWIKGTYLEYLLCKALDSDPCNTLAYLLQLSPLV